MPLVYHAFPTACPIPQALACIEAWRDMGYGTAIIILNEEERKKLPANIVLLHKNNQYPGFARSVNRIARWTLNNDLECQIIVTGGDDVYPDKTKRADEIAGEFIEHFGGTLGVMQPHGDEWHHAPGVHGWVGNGASAPIWDAARCMMVFITIGMITTLSRWQNGWAFTGGDLIWFKEMITGNVTGNIWEGRNISMRRQSGAGKMQNWRGDLR
jgi:hypothetical protein